MMDIYQFIDSKDIREHCRKLGHQFNTVESAYLVWQGDWRHTLKEKHIAWQEIIDTMPDMTLKRHGKNWGSVHQCIKQYMEIEDKMVDVFYRTGSNIRFEGGEGALSDIDTYYDSVDEFIAAEKALNKDYNESQDETAAEIRAMDKFALKRADERGMKSIPTFSIVQNMEDGYNQAIFHDESYELIGLDIVDSSLLEYITEAEADFYVNFFAQMWFYVPTPFEKGDLVTTSNNSRPHVLEELCFWKNTPEQKKAFRSLEKEGESEDFNCGLITFAQGGKDIQFEYYTSCLSLEYYHGKLRQGEKVFTAISNYMKGEMDVTLLLTAYRAIMNEEINRQEREAIGRQFSSTGLRLAGLENSVEDKGG